MIKHIVNISKIIGIILGIMLLIASLFLVVLWFFIPNPEGPFAGEKDWQQRSKAYKNIVEVLPDFEWKSLLIYSNILKQTTHDGIDYFTKIIHCEDLSNVECHKYKEIFILKDLENINQIQILNGFVFVLLQGDQGYIYVYSKTWEFPSNIEYMGEKERNTFIRKLDDNWALYDISWIT